MAEANCIGQTDLFYSGTTSDDRLAKQICRRCEVQQECLDEALKKEESGIWGGLTARERTRYSIRVSMGKPVDSLLRSKQREQRRPSNVVQPFPLRIPFQLDRMPEVLQKAVVFSGFCLPSDKEVRSSQ
jgi:Transcription factor WhiB